MSELYIFPPGHRIMVKPDDLQGFEEDKGSKKVEGGRVTAGGLFIPDENKQIKREGLGRIWGTVVAVGMDAYRDFGEGRPWVKAGDRVSYARLAGKHEYDPVTGVEYVILNDSDIVVVQAPDGVKLDENGRVLNNNSIEGSK